MASRASSAANLFGMRRCTHTIEDVLAASGCDLSSNDMSGVQLTLSVAAKLPVEILQSIYWYLSPLDFNAARHTCSNWMNASLRLQLLAEQLKRGGWWSEAATRTPLFQEWRKAWPMSCYLARECALAGSWTGNGLGHGCTGRIHTSLTRSNSINLSNIKQKSDEAGQPSKSELNVCTTSLCGKYFLAASGMQLYTYEIEGNAIRLLSKTTCEQNVTAASIDVGLDHFAVAVLLEGRIGVYLDLVGTLTLSSTESQWESSRNISNNAAPQAPVMDFGANDGYTEAPIDIEVGTLDEFSASAGSVGETSVLHTSVETVTSRSWAEYLNGRRARVRGTRRMPISFNGVWPHGLHLNEKGRDSTTARKPLQQIVYRNICTDEDPPCSVAISPTRQCVAFGCRSGVELYWVCRSSATILYFVPR